MGKEKIAISFSGGRTSAYMTHRLLSVEKLRDRYDVRVLFANTGQEHEKTLEFVDRCDREFGFAVVWLEAVVNPLSGEGTRHRVVSFDTASRDGEPFEDVIAKYGIPTAGYPHCNRELKLAAMNAYLRSVGWGAPRDYTRVVGIRADEMDRVNPNYRQERIWYPLIDWGVDKEQVTTFWSRQSFDLEIPEHLGNCVWCWKKSLRKHMTLAKEEPWVFEFPARMERKYAFAGARKDGDEGTPRRFFRRHMTVNDIFSLAGQPFERFMDGDKQRQMSIFSDMDRADGCSESCDPFGTDEDQEAA